MIWMAWLAAAIAVAGFVVFGMLMVPSKSSAVVLPDVRSARQALTLSSGPRRAGGHSASLCWWLAKPLHRARYCRMNTPSRIVTPERRSVDVRDTAQLIRLGLKELAK